MKQTANVAQLKAKLSEYLRTVKSGTGVVSAADLSRGWPLLRPTSGGPHDARV